MEVARRWGRWELVSNEDLVSILEDESVNIFNASELYT